MPLPYCNNLQKNDRVIHAKTKRPGSVATQPRDSSRMTSILWQGCSTPVYEDVMDLRLVCANGEIDEHPPIDGEPPPRKHELPKRTPDAAEQAAIDVLKKERDRIDARMKEMEIEFKTLRGEREKYDKAIAALAPA